MNKKITERKKRFLEAKQSAGSIDKLLENEKNKPYKVYFDTQGEILCFTKNDITPEEDWLTYDFTQDQLQILIDNGTNNYMVVKDPLNDNVYSIEVKKKAFTESFVEDFLVEITHDLSEADMYCEVTEENLNIWVSDETRKRYEGVNPISATMKGRRILPFYATAKHDPYVLFQKHFVGLCELLENDVVSLKNNGDFRKFSIYTRKIFDSYVRVYND